MKMILAPGGVGSPKVSKGLTSPKLVRKTVGSARVGRIVSPKTTRMTRLKVPAAPKKPAPVRKLKSKHVADCNAVKPATKSGKILDGAFSLLFKSLATEVTTNADHPHQRMALDGKLPTPKKIVFDNFDEFMKLLRSLYYLCHYAQLIFVFKQNLSLEF